MFSEGPIYKFSFSTLSVFLCYKITCLGKLKMRLFRFLLVYSVLRADIWHFSLESLRGTASLWTVGINALPHKVLYCSSGSGRLVSRVQESSL